MGMTGDGTGALGGNVTDCLLSYLILPFLLRT